MAHVPQPAVITESSKVHPQSLVYTFITFGLVPFPFYLKLSVKGE